MNRITKLVFCMALFFLITSNIISAQPTIDKEVLERLNNTKLIQVIVTLEDVSDVSYTNAKSLNEKSKIYQRRKELNNRDQLEILSSLSYSEFKLDYASSIGRWFSGNITVEGINKLKDSSNVLRVYIPIEGETVLQDSIPLINVNPDVWDLGYTGKDQAICVVDSGVNYTHLDLGGCTQTNNISDGSCSKVIGGYDFFNNDADPMDDHGHGTHVAGIAAANGSIKGVAPDAKLVVVKATNNEGNWGEPDLSDSISWCNDNRDLYNISVITISLGSFALYDDVNDCDTTDIGIVVNEAYNTGIFVDASSGNNANLTHISLPACASNATSVGATYDFEDTVWSLTNRGSLLALLAPGSIINSTYINGGYYEGSGTSAAAPHVAGAAALLLEAAPDLTPDEIRQILKESGVTISDAATGLNFSRIDVLAAIDSLYTCTSWTSGSCGTGSPGCNSIQRQYTRSCSSSACDSETKCEYDETCATGSTIIVCQNGTCDYTSIQSAVDVASTNDLINVIDEGVYNERVKI